MRVVYFVQNYFSTSSTACSICLSVILMVQNIGPLQNEASLWKKNIGGLENSDGVLKAKSC